MCWCAIKKLLTHSLWCPYFHGSQWPILYYGDVLLGGGWLPLSFCTSVSEMRRGWKLVAGSFTDGLACQLWAVQWCMLTGVQAMWLRATTTSRRTSMHRSRATSELFCFLQNSSSASIHILFIIRTTDRRRFVNVVTSCHVGNIVHRLGRLCWREIVTFIGDVLLHIYRS